MYARQTVLTPCLGSLQPNRKQTSTISSVTVVQHPWVGHALFSVEGRIRFMVLVVSSSVFIGQNSCCKGVRRRSSTISSLAPGRFHTCFDRKNSCMSPHDGVNFVQRKRQPVCLRTKGRSRRVYEHLRWRLLRAVEVQGRAVCNTGVCRTSVLPLNEYESGLAAGTQRTPNGAGVQYHRQCPPTRP